MNDSCAAIAVGQKLPVQRLLPARKPTLRVTPESAHKTAVREETLDGEQPALGFAIDSVRLVTGASPKGWATCLNVAYHPAQFDTLCSQAVVGCSHDSANVVCNAL